MANESSDSHPVFVETNLDTRIVMAVTDQDTVAGFKQKVSVGHYSCFPDIGEITVDSLKVRRNGNFYHLLNSVPIKSAFEGVKKNWFLFADATRSQGKATLDCKKDSNNIHKNLSKDLDMGGARGSKLENRMDALENISTSGGKKRKKKKRKRTQTESVQPDTETEMNKKDVGSSNLMVTFAVMETENPESKRRKKAEEINGAEAKSHTHVNSAEDIVPLTSEQEKSFDDNLGTKESILLRTEDRQLSKVCSVDDDKFDENSILQNGGPKMVPEAKSTMSSIRDRNVSTTDAAVSTEIPDFSDKSEKKSKKTKAADSHANSAINIIPLTAEQESSFDGDLGTKKESILFQTENRQLSEVFPHDNDKIDKQSVLDNENTKMVPEAKGTVSNIRDIDISATDAAIPTEVQNPTAKKRKKSKKSKASNAEWKVSTSEAEHVESSENAIQSICKSHRPSVQDNFGAETKGGDKIFSQTEDVEVAKLESPNTQERRFHVKDCHGAGHEDASLQLAQVVRIQESTDDIDDKVDHNVSKPSLSTSNLVEDQGMMEQVAHTEDLLLSTKGKKEEGKASRKKRKSKSKTDNSVNESCNIGPESGTVEYEAKSLQQQELSGHVLSPQLPSNAANCSVAGPCLVNESRDGTNDVEGDKLESPNTRERRFHDKDFQGAGHEDASLQLAQDVRIQGNTDDADDKVNHNVSKPSPSTSNLVKDQGMMEQVAHTENLLLSTKGKKEEGKASRKKRKSKSKTDNSVNESCNIGPESGTVSEYEAKSLQQQELSGHVLSPQLPSNAINCSVAGPCLVNESRDGTNDVEGDKLENLDTRERRFRDKDCQGAGHEDASLQLAQDVRIQGSTDDTDDKVNHIVCKPSLSTSNLVKDQGMMEQVAHIENLLLSTKGKKEEGKASRKKRKSKSKTDNSVNESCTIGPESGTVSEYEAKSLQQQEFSGHVVSSQLPSNAVNCSVAGPCLVNESRDETNDVEGDKLESPNTRERRFHDKDCQGAAHEDGSLLLAQVVRIQGSTDDTDDKVNRNDNKPSVSTSNLVKDQGRMEQVAPLISTKGKKEKASRKKKSKSKTDNSVNESWTIGPESGTVSEYEAKSLQQQELSGHVLSPQLPSNAVNCSVAGPCLVNESRDGTNDVEGDKLESPNTRERRFHDKDCQGAGHEDASLQLAQDVRIQGNTDDTDGKVNHNVSKPSVSTSNLVKDQGMMDQVAPLLSTKGKTEGGRASRRKSKSKSKPDNSVNELCNIGPESDTVREFEAKSLQKQELSGHVVSPSLPPNAVNCSVAGPCLVNGSSDGTNDGDKVNFRNYFVAKNASQVITPAKELEPVKRDAHQANHDKKLKIDKKAKPCTLNSLGTSSDLEKPHAEIENQGHKKKTVSAIPDTSQLQRSNSEPHSNGSSLNIAREIVVTLLADNDKVKALPINVSRDKVVDSSKELKAQHEVQFHSPSGSYVHTSKVNSKAAKISFVEKTEDVANGSQNHKSLSDVPKEVFSESSTETYEDKGDEKQDSDASTMNPSDTSDDSDGESEVDLNSPGSSWRNITKNGGNRKTRSQTTILKNMDLQSILRGSRSYKKAKLSASQSQPEDELSPPPFDLDG